MFTEEEAGSRQEARQGQGAGVIPDGGVPQEAPPCGPQPLRRQGTGTCTALQGEVPLGQINQVLASL